LPPRIQKVADSAALARAGAEEFVKAATLAVDARGTFSVALSGGSTPKAMFALLVDDARVPWEKIRFFWGDERHVPPDHPDSNYRMATEAMLSKVPISDTHIWRIRAEYADAGKAAAEYETVLREQLGEPPVFDLVMLGMGPEGHTLSLFPGTKALGETTRLVVSNWVGKFYTDRITMTAQVLHNARAILFLIGGEDKALALKGVLEGPVEPDQLPAQLLLSSGERCLWLIDETAGKMLSKANIQE
jgi:6-phosphogluconolactonase